MSSQLSILHKKLCGFKSTISPYVPFHQRTSAKRVAWSFSTITLGVVCLILFLTVSNTKQIETLIAPIISTLIPLHQLEETKKGHEIFGFAPHWNLQKLDNVDFNTLTTLAYFGVPITETGELDTDDIGYERFHSTKATEIFKKAHNHGTRVVLTLTIMDNETIEAFLDSPEAQKTAITQTIDEVKGRGIDGVNIDIEYVGTPDAAYRDSFSSFVENMTTAMHEKIPGSYVTASVYAASAKDKKLYDIARIGNGTDAVFMMAYDFATTGSDTVIPTSPLYGYKEGKYWYDVSTAVDDFLKVMPAEKLILGLPWYGYNYPVSEPQVKAAKYEGYSYYYWCGKKKRCLASFYPSANAQTYASAEETITADMSGWDEVGKVGWKAYQEDGIWRMLFLDDARSLKIKYQFAKEKKLGGVGMWALGFDKGRDEMWALLRSEFGEKLANRQVTAQEISEKL